MMFLQLPTPYLKLMGAIIVGGFVLLIVLLKLRRRAKRLGNIGLSLWMICGLLVLIELGFAAFYDTTDSFNRTNVSRRWFKRHYDFNPEKRGLFFQSGESESYRAAKTFPRDTDGKDHVVFLGDSFTFGHGVPDVRKRFSDLVGASLQTSQAGRYEISNLSKPGSDLYWVKGMLTELDKDDYSIDRAIYVICLNDIETFKPDSDALYADIGKHDPQFILFRETYFFNLAYFRVMQYTLPEIQDYYGFVKDYYEGEPWQKMKRVLDQTVEECSDRDCRFQVVIFPFLHNVGDDYPFQKIHSQIVAHCEANKIDVLDLEPVFRAHAGERLTVNMFDAHPNEHAHQLAATAIENAFFGAEEADGSETAE